MGAAFSGGSLCRMVGAVEIVVSTVIIGFGAQTLQLFYSMDEDLQIREKFDRIQYSAITAITQGSLTILASLMILFASRQKTGQRYLDVSDEDLDCEDEPEGSEKRSSLDRAKARSLSTQQIVRKLSLMYKLWLAFSVISIGLLLVVFLSSFEYCIQSTEDRERHEEISDRGKIEFLIEDGKKRAIPRCYSESSEILDLREALANLYSYCLVNIFTLFVFMFVVYYQLKRVTRIGRNRYHVKEDRQKVLPRGGGEEEEEEKEGVVTVTEK